VFIKIDGVRRRHRPSPAAVDGEPRVLNPEVPASYVVVCLTCELIGEPQASHAAAAALALVHDQLHHGGREEAEVATERRGAAA
jgi:hypothetical protein